MHFTPSVVALFRTCRLLAGKVRTGQYLLNGGIVLSRDNKADLTRFDTAVTEVLEGRILTDTDAKRISKLLTKVEKLFENEDASTKLWFVGMRACLPELSDEIDEEIEAHSASVDHTEPFSEKLNGVPIETTAQRLRRKQRSRESIPDENESEEGLLT